MQSAFLYLGIMLAVICVWFILLKRPVYESVFVSFILLVAITNKWSSVLEYINEGMGTSLLYSMVVFVAMSILLDKTKIIDSTVSIILCLMRKIPGGAGYVSVIASAFMGSLSGSGPGNVMTTGVITIPAMKKSGFPPELAANIESNASYLGNMIPPSSNIVAALGAYLALYPTENLTIGKFWLVCWGCSLWFILLKMIMVFAFCKYYKVKPIAKEDLPDLKDTLKTSWQGLLLPIIILLPFVFDFIFKETLFTQRLGASGAKYFSSSMLFFVAGIAAFYTVLVAKNKKDVSPNQIAKLFGEKIKSISPAIGTCLFGYMLGSLFKDLNVAEGLKMGITALNMGKVGLAFVIPLFTCFLGMVIPGSSLVVMFGSVFISLFASVGINPLLVAAMLPCICGVMCGITPPLALGMYAGMSIAESDFGKTVKNDLWWVATQYILEVIVLLELLPILGL
ncbi:MAG: TRAP transporter large permease subunit [Spirochaetaceae bacterium]|nr:TRAP transporter large permease subunit [Spirochaetaceae bacterium]